MGKVFLQFYVGVHIFIIFINIMVNIFGKEMVQFLSSDDWLLFIIACGALAISEALEKNQNAT